MPVRIKITLLFTLLVAVILALVVTAVYYVSYTVRIKSMHARLTNRVITIGRLLNQTDVFSNRLIRKIDSSTSVGYRDKAIQAYNYRNSKVYAYSDDPNDSVQVSTALLKEARVAGTVFFTVGKKDALAFHYVDNDTRLVIIAVAEDIEGRKNLDDLSKILLLSYTGGLLTACLGGFVFSKGLLHPVRKIADSVNRVSAQNLSLRIKTTRRKDEWRYLSDTINDLLNRLQESFDLQKRFISNASHELSTPLTSISNQIEVSLQRERSAEEYRKVMQSVHQDVMHMNHLTKTLLTFAKASGKPEGINIAPIRIDEILFRLAAAMMKANDRCSVLLEFEDLPEEEEGLLVSGNEELLFAAIKNLVSNACKYSNNNQVSIKLAIQNKEIMIAVSDKGIGIPSSELKNIFQPFHRANDKHAEEGFGLGLSLASRIIKLHKGNIEVSSVVNQGSTFLVKLPCAANYNPMSF